MENLDRFAGYGALPLYKRIKEALKKGILDGEFAPHAKLPSENALMKMFNVSRITVRQALRDLHREGLIFSIQGKGSFVSKPKVVQNIQRLQGFGEALAQWGYKPATKVIEVSECKPSTEVAGALSLTKDETVLMVKRVRFVNLEPVSLEISFFPMEIGSVLRNYNLAQDIFPMLENELDIPLSAADLKIGADNADGELCDLLNMPEGGAVLRITRLVQNRKGRPVDFEYLAYKADSYQYQVRVERY